MVEIKGFNGFGAELVDNVLYFFDDKSNIFILLVRHDGKFNLLDLIRKSGKVRQTLKLEFVGRNGFNQPTDKAMKSAELNRDLLFMFRIRTDGLEINFGERLQAFKSLFEFMKEMGSRLELEEIAGDVIEKGKEIFESFDDLGEVFVELRFGLMGVNGVNLEHRIKNPPEGCFIVIKKIM